MLYNTQALVFFFCILAKMFVAVRTVVILAFAITCVTCWGDKDDHPGMRKVQAKCQKSVQVDPEIFARAEKGDFADDDSLRRYINCVLETAQVMNADGAVNMANFIKDMKPEAREYFGPKFIACQNAVDDASKLVKSMKLYSCFRDMSGDKWYFI